jgi:hypothetical protein
MPIFKRNGKQHFFIHVPKTGGSSIESTLQPHVSMTLKHNGIPPGFPCPPQHLHYEEIDRRFDLSMFDTKFAIVRHPVNRLVSEYKFRTANRNKFISFDVWAERALGLAHNDRYCLNNHMRPQVEFVGPGVEVFHYEEGLEGVFQNICNRIGVNGLSLNLSWEKRGRSAQIRINQSLFDLITRFYAKDFEEFNYDPKVGLGLGTQLVADSKKLSLRRAKQTLEWIALRPDDKRKRRKRRKAARPDN